MSVWLLGYSIYWRVFAGKSSLGKWWEGTKKSNLPRIVGVGTWATCKKEFCLPEHHLHCGRGIPAGAFLDMLKVWIQWCSHAQRSLPVLPRAPHTWAGSCPSKTGSLRFTMNHSNTFLWLIWGNPRARIALHEHLVSRRCLMWAHVCSISSYSIMSLQS